MRVSSADKEAEEHADRSQVCVRMSVDVFFSPLLSLIYEAAALQHAGMRRSTVQRRKMDYYNVMLKATQNQLLFNCFFLISHILIINNDKYGWKWIKQFSKGF